MRVQYEVKIILIISAFNYMKEITGKDYFINKRDLHFF